MKNLHKLRVDKQLKQEELAEELGFSKTTIQEYDCLLYTSNKRSDIHPGDIAPYHNHRQRRVEAGKKVDWLGHQSRHRYLQEVNRKAENQAAHSGIEQGRLQAELSLPAHHAVPVGPANQVQHRDKEGTVDNALVAHNPLHQGNSHKAHIAEKDVYKRQDHTR